MKFVIYKLVQNILTGANYVLRGFVGTKQSKNLFSFAKKIEIVSINSH